MKRKYFWMIGTGLFWLSVLTLIFHFLHLWIWKEEPSTADYLIFCAIFMVITSFAYITEKTSLVFDYYDEEEYYYNSSLKIYHYFKGVFSWPEHFLSGIVLIIIVLILAFILLITGEFCAPLKKKEPEIKTQSL